jgi:ElaB/YqjD/DUF883 family membrane-anchored ribosome-binding protein
MNSKYIIAICFSLFMGLFTSLHVQAQADTSAKLLALKSTLTELQAVTDRAQIGIDSIAASKIEGTSNEVQRLLKEIEKILNGKVKDVNEAVQEVAKQTHQLSSSLRKTISETQRRAFLDVNTALSIMSQTLDGIPLVKVDPYAAALDPPRLRADVTNRRITIYGYFPDSKDGRTPSVIVSGKTIQLTKETGAKLSFDLPKDLILKEEEYIDIDISVPTRSGWFGLWKSEAKFSDRVYVERSYPFSCDLEVLEVNPALYEVLRAPNEFTDEARTMGGGGRPSNIRTLSASDLLIATVPGAAERYDLSSVKIQSPGAHFSGGAACSDHANWSGNIRRWNPELVEFELRAPSVGQHMHTGTRRQCAFGICVDVPYVYSHGGGGSHANIGLRPTFVVRRQGVEPFVRKASNYLPTWLSRVCEKRDQVPAK